MKEFIKRTAKFMGVNLVITLIAILLKPSDWMVDYAIELGACLSIVIGLVTTFFDKKCRKEQGFTGTFGASIVGSLLMAIVILLVFGYFSMKTV